MVNPEDKEKERESVKRKYHGRNIRKLEIRMTVKYLKKEIMWKTPSRRQNRRAEKIGRNKLTNILNLIIWNLEQIPNSRAQRIEIQWMRNEGVEWTISRTQILKYRENTAEKFKNNIAYITSNEI